MLIISNNCYYIGRCYYFRNVDACTDQPTATMWLTFFNNYPDAKAKKKNINWLVGTRVAILSEEQYILFR